MKYSVLAFEGLQLPGTYNITVTVSGNTVDSDVAVPFRLSGEGKQRTLHPCLTAEQLTRYGVDISGYPSLSADAQCADPEVIPQSTADFDFNRQQLSLVFPPQAMLPVLKGIAPETLWDDGRDRGFIMRDIWMPFSFLRRHAGSYAGVLHSLTTRRMSVALSNIRTKHTSTGLRVGLTGQVPGLNRGPPDWPPGH
ncbi:pilin outer membrane usher protein SafC [Salmonella enterica subsp. arizonae]|nr:pilin outer membrane usher protein SafC [Salmonella enterica subsp. arizonae]